MRCGGTGQSGPYPGDFSCNTITTQGRDARFTTAAALILDTRLTPLERNGWQVLCMLRAAERLSPMMSLGQLRR